MSYPRRILFLLFFCCYLSAFSEDKPTVNSLTQKGWAELVKDNDANALKYFGDAYQLATENNDTEGVAQSLLNLGIVSYSVSYSEGLSYCFRAMDEFKKLEKTDSKKALTGRSKCLQLISTIYGRQGKYRESIDLSKEAMQGFPASADTSGYLGLIYNSLAATYTNLNKQDSAEYFSRKALEENILTGNKTYLPAAYISVADIELLHGKKEASKTLYMRALEISDSTENRQTQVMSRIGIGKWYSVFEKDFRTAEEYYLSAYKISKSLNDKAFNLKALRQLILLYKEQGRYQDALAYKEEYANMSDSLYNWEKQKILKSLEVQFDVSEKDRQLQLAKKEKDITQLTNYLLWGTVGFLITIAIGIFIFLRRINKRDKLLLQTKEELVSAIEKQKLLQEQQMKNELEFRESQLSAMTLQMLQKNELMQELKEQMEQDKALKQNTNVDKIINRGQIHDKEWSDFNTYFESVNKNFYSRLKKAYPDVSPNEMKICALIKLNLSIKEMAGILNISPDSVKTARYRLRKKLQLNTEDNLTEFILKL